MRTAIAAAITGGILLASSIQLLAHHSGAAEFDVNSHIELSGVVTKIEWTNPHAHFYIDVKDANGKVVNWNLELASPNVLVRNGWSRHSRCPRKRWLRDPTASGSESGFARLPARHEARPATGRRRR